MWPGPGWAARKPGATGPFDQEGSTLRLFIPCLLSTNISHPPALAKRRDSTGDLQVCPPIKLCPVLHGLSSPKSPEGACEHPLCSAHGLHGSRSPGVKAQVLPYPSSPPRHLLPVTSSLYRPHSFHSNHTVLPAVPRTCRSWPSMSCAFAWPLHVLCPLPSYVPLAHSSTQFWPLLQGHVL